MDAFALGLDPHLPASGDRVWSPYSVASALGLAAAGARGRTYDELTRALGAAPQELRLAEAARLEDAEIAVANTLWLREGLPLEDAYERAAGGFPGAALHSADFAADPERVRAAINDEVSKTTRELIQDLLPAGSLAAETSAVIVNALYLKAAWTHPFAKNDTVPVPFYGPSGRYRVQMMGRTGRMPYAEADGWRMATLAAGGDVVADVLLGPDGAAPSLETLHRLRANVDRVKVALTVPKFRVEGQLGLTVPLGELGVETAFTDDADFSGMTSSPVRLDRIEHKAVLEVDEQGFEGAAATGMVMVPASMDMSRPVEFRVDHPFLVLVRHPATDAIYFFAHVIEP